MKKANLRNMLLCSALIIPLFTTMSYKTEGSNEQGVEAARDANATNSGTDGPAEDVRAGGAAGAEAGQTPQQTGGTSTDTTNKGISTKQGSYLK